MVAAEDNILILKDGRRLGYGDYGDPEGWPVLFFHGTPGSRLMARFAGGEAARQGVRLIAPERPGFGLSDFQPGRRLLDWPEDVAGLAAALGLDRFAVVGLSGGGPYALACAWKMPDRVAVAGIISGLGPVDFPEVRRGLGWGHRLTLLGVQRAPVLLRPALGLLATLAQRRPEQIIRLLGRTAPPTAREILRRPEVQRAQMDGIQEAFRGGVRGVVQEMGLLCRPWGFAVEEIRVPVYLWHGEADAIIPVHMGRFLAGRIPTCRAFFLPKADHLWIFEAYREVLGVVGGQGSVVRGQGSGASGQWSGASGRG